MPAVFIKREIVDRENIITSSDSRPISRTISLNNYPNRMSAEAVDKLPVDLLSNGPEAKPSRNGRLSRSGSDSSKFGHLTPTFAHASTVQSMRLRSSRKSQAFYRDCRKLELSRFLQF